MVVSYEYLMRWCNHFKPGELSLSFHVCMQWFCNVSFFMCLLIARAHSDIIFIADGGVEIDVIMQTCLWQIVPPSFVSPSSCWVMLLECFLLNKHNFERKHLYSKRGLDLFSMVVLFSEIAVYIYICCLLKHLRLGSRFVICLDWSLDRLIVPFWSSWSHWFKGQMLAAHPWSHWCLQFRGHLDPLIDFQEPWSLDSILIPFWSLDSILIPVAKFNIGHIGGYTPWLDLLFYDGVFTYNWGEPERAPH